MNAPPHPLPPPEHLPQQKLKGACTILKIVNNYNKFEWNGYIKHEVIALQHFECEIGFHSKGSGCYGCEMAVM